MAATIAARRSAGARRLACAAHCSTGRREATVAAAHGRLPARTLFPYTGCTLPPAIPPPTAIAALLLALGCAHRPTPTPAPPTTVAPAPLAPSAPDDPLDSLAWLAGTWVSDEPDGPRTVEHWLAPDGGTMLGVSRTAHAGRTVFFEYLRIEAQADGPAYLASPRGQDPPTRFATTASGPGFVTFENPTHDFPQRIEYRREGDRLQMRISGVQGGAAMARAWSMRRAGP